MFGRKSTEQLFAEAVRYQNINDVDHALSLYNQILSTDPGISDAWVNKANILSKRGDYDGALSSYRRALALANTRQELILSNMGLVEHLRNDYDSAISLFRQAIQLNSKYGWGWLGLIQALLAARRGEEAKQECGRFMLACTVEDKELYLKAKRLVDQFFATGSIPA